MLKAMPKPFTQLSMDDLIKEGDIICGSPDTVIEASYYSQKLHAGLMVSGEVGNMPRELVYKNMDLLASKILPALR